jgi:capsular polysaccharide biosynthesis protein
VHADRTMSLSNEKKLEKMFEEAGYEIIDPGKSLSTTYEQAELYNSASHIVTLPGAGLANCCFANPDVKVLILNNTNSYNFPHLEITRSLGIYCVESPKRIKNNNKIFGPTEIFESVKRDYPEFLL